MAVDGGSDPLAGSSWSDPSTVAGFASGSPNQALLQFARREGTRTDGHRALDIGCGAGRNAVPLAGLGWNVLGLDLSLPMLIAATRRAGDDAVAHRCQVALAAMDHLAVGSRSCDLIVAHGIWNLARSAREFRAAVQESARVAKEGAALFVFTFSRSTLAPNARPVSGEPFVFASVSGELNVFLTKEQLIAELALAGFDPDPALPLAELNPRRPGMLAASGSPVIWQGAFRFVATR